MKSLKIKKVFILSEYDSNKSLFDDISFFLPASNICFIESIDDLCINLHPDCEIEIHDEFRKENVLLIFDGFKFPQVLNATDWNNYDGSHKKEYEEVS